MSRYPNKTFEVARYRSETRKHEVDAEVFGSGFVHIKDSLELYKTSEMKFVTILLDPSEIDGLMLALREAKRRRDGSERRRRRKLAREQARALSSAEF